MGCQVDSGGSEDIGMSRHQRFCYKVLLVDDYQQTKAREKQLVGVRIERVGTVEEALVKVFGVTRVEDSNYEDYKPHDYDVVLLDFDLIPDQKLSNYPLGGLSLFPLFANNFKGKGQCVVVNYSDKGQTLLKKIFEIGHSIQHRHQLKVAQTGFIDIDFASVIQDRARSFLGTLPPDVLFEIVEQVPSKCPTIKQLLNKPIKSLTEMVGMPMTLGDLRPDVGRRAFKSIVTDTAYKPKTRTIDAKIGDDFREWLQELQLDRSWCLSIQRLYHIDAVRLGAHIEKRTVPKNFWKRNILLDNDAGIAKCDDVRFPINIAQELRKLKWTDGGDRCSKWHKFFRLSLGNKQPGKFPQGYSLNDIRKATRLSLKLSLSNCGQDNFYLYMPQCVLTLFLSGLAGEMNSHEFRVRVFAKEQLVQFALHNPRGISSAFVNQLARGQIDKWAPGLRQWGGVYAMTSSSTYLCLAPGMGVPVMGIGADWGLQANDLAVRFPIERFRKSPNETQ